MKKEDLKKLSTEQLLAKEKGTKTFIGVFVALIIVLGFFVFRDFFTSEESSYAELTIWICTVGGMVSLFPELKAVQEEIRNRG